MVWAWKACFHKHKLARYKEESQARHSIFSLKMASFAKYFPLNNLVFTVFSALAGFFWFFSSSLTPILKILPQMYGKRTKRQRKNSKNRQKK